jgi:hypothetical protein
MASEGNASDRTAMKGEAKVKTPGCVTLQHIPRKVAVNVANTSPKTAIHSSTSLKPMRSDLSEAPFNSARCNRLLLRRTNECTPTATTGSAIPNKTAGSQARIGTIAATKPHTASARKNQCRRLSPAQIATSAPAAATLANRSVEICVSQSIARLYLPPYSRHSQRRLPLAKPRAFAAASRNPARFTSQKAMHHLGASRILAIPLWDSLGAGEAGSGDMNRLLAPPYGLLANHHCL